MSVRIPAGKLGTVRVDRTVDAYSTTITNYETVFNVKSYIPSLILQRQLSAIATPFINANFEEEHSYIPLTKWNHDDEDISDIAVIYSIVRHSTTRRTSSPGLSASPLLPNYNISQPYLVKSYKLEPPLIPIVTHVSKQAQIKTLPPTHTATTSIKKSLPTSSQLLPPTRIQTSTSFTSHDRPSVPTIAIKPRPYSFRNTGRNVLERRISNITERVSQLHETFFSRLSNTPPKQRNRSLSTFQTTSNDANIYEYNSSDIRFFRPRPKSETYDDHHRVNTGNMMIIV